MFVSLYGGTGDEGPGIDVFVGGVEPAMSSYDGGGFMSTFEYCGGFVRFDWYGGADGYIHSEFESVTNRQRRITFYFFIILLPLY